MSGKLSAIGHLTLHTTQPIESHFGYLIFSSVEQVLKRVDWETSQLNWPCVAIQGDEVDPKRIRTRDCVQMSFRTAGSEHSRAPGSGSVGREADGAGS